jgi:hypothetical protein
MLISSRMTSVLELMEYCRSWVHKHDVRNRIGNMVKFWLICDSRKT